MPSGNLEIDNQAQELGQRFAQVFGATPRIFQAPGYERSTAAPEIYVCSAAGCVKRVA
jgi:hypothetical protein